jgi:hypothetical protein
MAINLDGGVRTSLDELNASKDFADSISDDTKKLGINWGHEVVQQHLASELSSSSLLRRIELNLAAHYVSITNDPDAEKVSGGDASATFMIDGGTGLDASAHGQAAMALDTTGNLAELNEGGGKNINMVRVSGGAD